MNKTKRILLSVSIVSLAVASFVAGTSAYFSDTETSTGNVLAAGAIDLQIDNTSYYNGKESVLTTWTMTDLTDELFFDFDDLKPGDWGEDTVSIHVDSNDAWACVDIDLTENADVTCNEPESADDLNCVEGEDGRWTGDLADELYFAFWADDGDNVWEVDEPILTKGWGSEVLNGVTWPLADSQHYVLEEGPLVGGQTYYIGKAWCFGEMQMEQLSPRETVRSPLTAGNITCDGASSSNASQTDKVMGDITFRAIQARHNEGYLCDEGICDHEEEGWAVGVYSAALGTQKDTDPLPSGRDDPTAALGTPDGVFVSLGVGGEIVLEFNGYISGSEVQVLEVTYGRDSYPEEAAKVYVRTEVGPWSYVGRVTNHDDSGYGTVDVSGHGEIRYVMLVDDTDYSLHGNDADGYDVDAVTAVVCMDEPR